MHCANIVWHKSQTSKTLYGITLFHAVPTCMLHAMHLRRKHGLAFAKACREDFGYQEMTRVISLHTRRLRLTRCLTQLRPVCW
jgi:hypothetical protein